MFESRQIGIIVTPTAKNHQVREPRCNRGRVKGALSFASFTLERAKKMMKEVVLFIISPSETSLKAHFLDVNSY